MIIIIEEYGLRVDVQVQRPNPVKLFRPGDLAVNDPVAAVSSRRFTENILKSVKDFVEAGVSDRMNRDLHPVPMSERDQFGQLLRREQGESRGVRAVGVRAGKVCSAATEGTVSEQFERPDFEQFIAGSCRIPRFDEPPKFILIG